MRQPQLKQIGGIKRGGEEEHKDHLGCRRDGRRREIQAGEDAAAERMRERLIFGFEEEKGKKITLRVELRHAKSVRPLGLAVRPLRGPTAGFGGQTGLGQKLTTDSAQDLE